mmetsp:Transcript_1212/g.2645  ORF Transcript_1212/g.2645 Transcript_1212/m.2645 type:complete len:293 (-) Transcript_1212:562-1440(-)
MGYLVKHVVLPVFIAINSALAYRCLFAEEEAVQDILEYWAPGRNLQYQPLTDLEKHLVHVMGSACLCFLLTEVAAIALDNPVYQTMTLAFQTLFFIIDGCSYFKMGRELAETPLAHAIGLGVLALGIHHMEMDVFAFGEVAAPTPDEKKQMLQAETTKAKKSTAAAVPARNIINKKNEPSKSKSPKKKKKMKNGINNSNGLSNTAPNGQKMPSLIVEKDMEKTKSINGTTTSMSTSGPSQSQSSDKKMPAAAAPAPAFIDEKKDETDVPALIIDDGIKSSSESSISSTAKAF